METPEYYLEVHSSGKNAARSKEHVFDTNTIPNDYAYVIERLNRYARIMGELSEDKNLPRDIKERKSYIAKKFKTEK